MVYFALGVLSIPVFYLWVASTAKEVASPLGLWTNELADQDLRHAA